MCIYSPQNIWVHWINVCFMKNPVYEIIHKLEKKHTYLWNEINVLIRKINLVIITIVQNLYHIKVVASNLLWLISRSKPRSDQRNSLRHWYEAMAKCCSTIIEKASWICLWSCQQLQLRVSLFDSTTVILSAIMDGEDISMHIAVFVPAPFNCFLKTWILLFILAYQQLL